MRSTLRTALKGLGAVGFRDRARYTVARFGAVAGSRTFPQVSMGATALNTYRARSGTVPAPTAPAAPRPMGRRGCVPGAVQGLVTA